MPTDRPGDADALATALRMVGEALPTAPYESADVERRLARRASRRRSMRGAGVASVLTIGALTIWGISGRERNITRAVDPSVPPTESATTAPGPTTAPPTSGPRRAGPTDVTPPPRPEPTLSTPADYAVVPEPPLDPRKSSASAGTEAGLLIWGGTTPFDGGATELPPRPLDDGAWFDLGSRTWRLVPESPLPGGPATAVALGESIVVHARGQFAAYTPSSDSWSAIPTPPGEGPGAESYVFVIDGLLVDLPLGQVFDPASGVWRAMEPTPVGGLPTFAGGPAGVFSITLTGDGDSTVSVARLDAATGAWTPVGTAPIQAQGASLDATVDEGRLVVTSWSGMQAAAFDVATGVWTVLPPIPQFDYICDAVGVGVGRSTLLGNCGRWLLTPDGRWSPLFAEMPGLGSEPPGMLDLIALGPSTAVVDGRFVRFEPESGRPIGSTGPYVLAGALIPKDLVVGGISRTGPEPVLTASLRGGCELAARPGEGPLLPLIEGGQRTLAEALAARSPDATTVGFHNPWFGSNYSLSCPDPSWLRPVAVDIEIAGESVNPIDVTATFAGEMIDSARLDGELDRLITLLRPLGQAMDPPASVAAAGWGPPENGRAFATIEYAADDRRGPIDGALIELSLVDDGSGLLRVERATQWTRCTAGADPVVPTYCRGAEPPNGTPPTTSSP